MKYFRPIFKSIRSPFKRLKLFLKQKAGWLGVPKIVLYRGHGDTTNAFINGQVIEDKGLAKPEESQKILQNILATIKRFSSDEIAGVRVRVDFLGESVVTKTDENGYFQCEFFMKDKLNKSTKNQWYPVYAELLDRVTENQPNVNFSSEIRIISKSEQRIIVSDIDDTILISHSTQTLRKIRLMLLKNAHTRLPFEGVPSFYRALEKGKEGTAHYPFFYVSSSEWNLYDLLDDFFEINHIPKGVFQLKKLEHSIYKFWKSGGGTHEHKYHKIKSLMEFYSDQKFILLGDSGQKDPYIYKRLAREFPGRVETVYIRSIKNKKYSRKADEIKETLKQLGTDYLEVETTRDALPHARRKEYLMANVALSTG